MMDIKLLADFLLWCLLINIGIYVLTALAIVLCRDLVCKILTKIFALDQQTILKSLQGYLAGYKLLITVFNFVPWLALLIIK